VRLVSEFISGVKRGRVWGQMRGQLPVHIGSPMGVVVPLSGATTDVRAIGCATSGEQPGTSPENWPNARQVTVHDLRLPVQRPQSVAVARFDPA
jgi:hypothetical protein